HRARARPASEDRLLACVVLIVANTWLRSEPLTPELGSASSSCEPLEQIAQQSFKQVELVAGHWQRFGAARGLRRGLRDRCRIGGLALQCRFGRGEPKRHWRYSAGRKPRE